MRNGNRQRIRVLYEYSCGYCGVRESDSGARLTLDHFRPRSSSGEDEIGNLVYCCHACNEFKGDYWHEEEVMRLLRPLFDDVTKHYFVAEDARILALTVRGSNHIERLRLNRPELIAYRLQRQNEAALEEENQQILQLLESLRQDNEALREHITKRNSS